VELTGESLYTIGFPANLAPSAGSGSSECPNLGPATSLEALEFSPPSGSGEAGGRVGSPSISSFREETIHRFV
jgi:hypothetical protein